MQVAINLKAFTAQISDRDFEQLCTDNPEAKLETNAQGQLIVMSPTGSQSGKFNLSLSSQVWYWNSQTLLGVAFDSSTGFKLSNGAVRSPDVSWIAIARWNALTDKQKRGFAPIDPDFVIELMSPTDDLLELQQKMSEYMACGVKLGWLINPDEKQVEIYRQGQEKQVLSSPISLSGQDFLPGLTVDLAEIFA
jgi:Uma2 family endonuclease